MKVVAKDRAEKLYYDFLPSALEIIEKPPSAIGKTLIWLITLIICTAITWSILGKVDTVAIARGKVIPYGNIKVVQSADTAIITAINVIEGQKVKKGDVLVELDDSLLRSEQDILNQKLEVALVEKELLTASQSGADIDVILKDINSQSVVVDPVFIDSIKSLVKVRADNYGDNRESVMLEIKQTEQAIVKAESELEQLNMQYNIVYEQLKKLQVLFNSGSVSYQDYQSKLDESYLIEQQKQTQIETIKYHKDQKSITQQKLDVLSSGKNIELYQEIISKDKEILELKQALEKLDKRISLTKLTSPVDGTVQGIGNNTLGGVVTSAQPIMSIVPDDTPLVVEAMVLNRDIGFIAEDMSVEIKLDTFPFQKYGLIEGKILTISPDAIEQENIGYVYKVLVSFDKRTIALDNREANITAGMTASCEVKLKKRRIIEFFIPAIDYIKDSVKYR